MGRRPLTLTATSCRSACASTTTPTKSATRFGRGRASRGSFVEPVRASRSRRREPSALTRRRHRYGDLSRRSGSQEQLSPRGSARDPFQHDDAPSLPYRRRSRRRFRWYLGANTDGYAYLGRPFVAPTGAGARRGGRARHCSAHEPTCLAPTLGQVDAAIGAPGPRPWRESPTSSPKPQRMIGTACDHEVTKPGDATSTSTPPLKDQARERSVRGNGMTPVRKLGRRRVCVGSSTCRRGDASEGHWRLRPWSEAA